jgi:tellurite resistance protein TehA-like permease
MTAPSLAPSRSSAGELGPGLWRLGYIAVAALAFVLGVLVPYLTDDGVPPVDSTWDALYWSGLVSVLSLPLVACGVAAFSGATLARSHGASRVVNLAAVAVSVAGVLVYLSPWGQDATRWLLD